MRRTILLFAFLALLAVAGVRAEAEFELESTMPDLLDTSAESFLSLDDMGMESPDESFAELSESTESEAEEDEPALLETEQESETKPWHRNPRNQPVARTAGEIKCLDGDCTRATGVRKAAVGTHPNAGSPKPPTKLEIALGAVKEEIMVRAKELHKEKDWSKKVANLIDEYQQKLQKVTGNIVHLRAQTKALLRKKKQIQNVQVQNKLRYKLQLAQADLNRLQKQMEHIAGKENEFTDTERQLKGTMNSLKNSLLKLRGQEPQKLEAEGI